MGKLELKHLAGYLPYGLKMHWENYEGEPMPCWELKCDSVDFVLSNQNKPILRPLSDLTKEIEHNGEKFVPIEIIGKIIDSNYTNLYDDENGSVVGYGEHIGCGCPYDCDCGRIARDFILKYNKEDKYFYSEISMDADYDNIIGQEDHPSYDLIQKLYEWHFDIHGGIGTWAIDINTLNKQL